MFTGGKSLDVPSTLNRTQDYAFSVTADQL